MFEPPDVGQARDYANLYCSFYNTVESENIYAFYVPFVIDSHKSNTFVVYKPKQLSKLSIFDSFLLSLIILMPGSSFC